MDLAVQVFIDREGGERDFFDPPAETGSAGFDSWRETVWGSPRARRLGARLLPRLADGDVYIEPYDIEALMIECVLFREHLHTLVPGMDALDSDAAGYLVCVGDTVHVERAEPVAHFRGIVAQRLANIEAAARYALIVGGGVAISTAVARPAPGEQTVPTSRCNARVSTRDRLIDSMRALLWERGYLGTSPKAIQQRAGAGQGSMYHHFAGKEDLAHVAITGTAAQMRAAVDEQLSGPGNAFDRIAGYLNRERDVLRGCPIGRLTQDTDVLSTPVLRAPIADTFAWLRTRLADVVREGIERDELDPGLDPAAVASMIAAILQGGYVLARAAASPEPFDEAVAGVLGLLAAHSARG